MEAAARNRKKPLMGIVIFILLVFFFFRRRGRSSKSSRLQEAEKVLEQAHQELRQARTTMELDEVLDRYYYRLDKHTVFNGDVPGNKRFMEMLEEKYERMG